MKPLIVSRSDLAGGAARAATRLALALREAGIGAEMLSAEKRSDYPWVIGRRSFKRDAKAIARSAVGTTLLRLQKPQDVNLRSINLLASRLDRTINSLPHDIVNLHWIGSEMLSIEAVGRITKPVVWTLHDMWGFAGAEHYTPDNVDARWRHGYPPSVGGGLDLDRATWKRKYRAWRRPQHVICPSNWLAECVRASQLMATWPVHAIANPLDLAVFQPWPKALAREMLRLPANTPLLGFGAMGGTRDPRKGWDLLSAALQDVAKAGIGVEAVIFGQSRPTVAIDVPMPTHWVGHLSDDVALALLYSAVDAVVVPSRQDNLPQTATEPQACGCPVVAFDTGGLRDAVAHGETGLLAAPFDTGVLARHLIALLGDADLRTRQGEAARARAERLWDTATLVARYEAVYDSAWRSTV